MIAPHTCGVILRVGTERDHDRLILLQRWPPVKTPPAHGTLARHARWPRGLGCGLLRAGLRCGVACGVAAGDRHGAGVLVVAQRRDAADTTPISGGCGRCTMAWGVRTGIPSSPASRLQRSLPIG